MFGFLYGKKKAFYEIVVRGLLARRMCGFLELQFERFRETEESGKCLSVGLKLVYVIASLAEICGFYQKCHWNKT